MSTRPGDAIAVIADIHGNSWALDAVIADARQAGIGRFCNLGDCAYGPLDPRGTMDRLDELDAVTVRGNQDRLLAADTSGNPTARYVRAELSAEQVRFLIELPLTAELDELLLCHGSPADDQQYLLEEVLAHGARPRPRAPAEVQRMLGATGPLVLCAHTHLPRLLPLQDARQVCNPGSVGLPAYEDDAPHSHVMESGSPHARYAIARNGERGWAVELRTVDYPWAEAAGAARRRGREDWAVALETGLAAPTIARGATRSSRGDATRPSGRATSGTLAPARR